MTQHCECWQGPVVKVKHVAPGNAAQLTESEQNRRASLRGLLQKAALGQEIPISLQSALISIPSSPWPTDGVKVRRWV